MKRHALVLTWLERECDGWQDILPWALFDREVSGQVVTHDAHGPVAARDQAKCRLSVRGRVADLNYIPFRCFNEAQGMDLGVLRLRFADSSRQAISRVEWRHVEDDAFSVARVTAERVPLHRLAQPYDVLRKRATRVRAEPGVRSGQLEFRRRIKLIYDGRCCVTGCDVVDALDACHIDAHRGASSDKPHNGLLLRTDLHTLFDKNMMAFDPQTLRVHFCAEARTWPEYAHLHRRVRLRLPRDRNPLVRPSVKALERRWRAFKELDKYGDG